MDISKADIKGFFETAQSAGRAFVSVAATGGYAGFIFDITKDETVELDSDITDHYVENGIAVQDHIALAPERVTVSGLVGEYKNVVENHPNALQKITRKLTTLQSYLPAISDAAQTAYDIYERGTEGFTSWEGITDTASDIGNLWKDYRNINIPANEQQRAFLYFEALRNSRVTFTIQTPFRYYTDMAIERIAIRQSGATRDESEFEVSFKKIRYVSTEIADLSAEGQRQGRNENQWQAITKKGVSKGIETGLSTVTSNLGK